LSCQKFQYLCFHLNKEALKKTKDKLILVTNDDGINAKGLKSLVEVAAQFGNVIVVAPNEGQSGMAHAITVKTPIRVHKISYYDHITTYIITGTPVDCVKMAIDRLLPRKPDLLLAGVNHGGNASSSVMYSGTMGAVIEGCLNSIPAIGFSLLDYGKEADFSAVQHYARKIIKETLKNGIPVGVCLNVNVPSKPLGKIKGIKICRQNRGVWREEFEHRTDPAGNDYYWLTGTFENLEPLAEDTDEWALKNNYVSLVPVQFDQTAYQFMKKLQKWELK
jgi:5'-nucleotidase